MNDREHVLACLRAAFEPYRSRYTHAAYDDTIMAPDTVGHRLQTMMVFVACLETGATIGTVGGQVNGDEGHIRGMAVVPAWQGRGVAGQLLASAEAALASAGCAVVTLDTTAPLARAIRFYEAQGYTASGRVTDFYGMSLFEYRKRLSPQPASAPSASR